MQGRRLLNLLLTDNIITVYSVKAQNRVDFVFIGYDNTSSRGRQGGNKRQN